MYFSFAILFQFYQEFIKGYILLSGSISLAFLYYRGIYIFLDEKNALTKRTDFSKKVISKNINILIELLTYTFPVRKHDDLINFI
jgi:hypothetical protein